MYEDFDEDWCQCPRCSGWGDVDCHCGGDLCVCEYHGDRPCPLCHGEGEVSEDTYEAYLEHERIFAEAMAKIDTEKDTPNDG